ncbi:DUF697 domain-containing protein [Portibacter marinus]|uniref:DUF697 domain-containing protein n=1 Tax=Portibacter marinus TaxID=2898660 RepID=UPI001F1CF13A|nr:DUF697 domain-containing protein [Portibacter marinus]
MEISDTQKIIADTTAKVSAISALPIPFLDVAAMTYFQYHMVKRLAEEHHLEVDNTRSMIISSLLSSLISKLVATGLENLASRTKLDKMLKDSLIRASISGFLTTIIGEAYELHFKNGGTLDDITLNSFAGYLESQFRSDRWSLSNLTDDFMKGIEEFTD